MNLYGALGILAALVALVFGINVWEKHIEERGYNKAAAIYAEAALKDEQKYRAEEASRAEKREAAIEKSNKETSVALADAARAKSAARSLQSTLDAINNRPPSSDPAVTEERKTTRTLGELFGVCSARYGLLGEAADAVRNAGKLCEQLYDSNVTPIQDAVRALGK